MSSGVSVLVWSSCNHPKLPIWVGITHDVLFCECSAGECDGLFTLARKVDAATVALVAACSWFVLWIWVNAFIVGNKIFVKWYHCCRVTIKVECVHPVVESNLKFLRVKLIKLLDQRGGHTVFQVSRTKVLVVRRLLL
jgi:hypothetical protein